LPSLPHLVQIIDLEVAFKEANSKLNEYLIFQNSSMSSMATSRSRFDYTTQHFQRLLIINSAHIHDKKTNKFAEKWAVYIHDIKISMTVSLFLRNFNYFFIWLATLLRSNK